jgi:hypothetical protein
MQPRDLCFGWTTVGRAALLWLAALEGGHVTDPRPDRVRTADGDGLEYLRPLIG